MFDMIAEVVIGLLKSLYGVSAGTGAGGGEVVKGKTTGAGNTIFAVTDLAGTTRFSVTDLITSVTNELDIAGGDFLMIASGPLLPPTSRVKWRASSFGTEDASLIRVAAGVVAPASGSSGAAAGWLQNTAGEARRTATQTVTDSATFAADDTLSLTVVSGRKYRFLLEYFFTTVNSSGVKVDLNGGSAAMTAINGMAFLYSSAGAVGNAVQITALTSSPALTASGTFAYVTISGSFQASGNGTFIPRFAQNTETGAAESVIAQIGSYLALADMP